MKFKSNPFHNQIFTKEIVRKNGMIFTVRERRDRFFFPDEWMAFFDNLTANQKFTFNFLINTGARINECANVNASDVDLQRQNIVFRFTKSRNQDGSRRIRTIPISSQFCKYLKKYIDSNALKANDKFPILSVPAANIAMKKCLQKTGIPDFIMFSVHNVRKTTEMFLLALGIEEMKVGKHMGHSLAIARKHYVSTDVFNYEDKKQMREIIGDLYER